MTLLPDVLAAVRSYSSKGRNVWVLPADIMYDHGKQAYSRCSCAALAGIEEGRLLAWLRNLVVKEMPNLVGVMARPRLRKRLFSLKAATSARRFSRPPPLSIALSQHVRACTCDIPMTYL